MYQQELIELGARGVPTFVIGDEVIVGFNRERIMSLIDYQVVNCPNCQKRLRVPKNKGKLKITCKHCDHQFITNT